MGRTTMIILGCVLANTPVRYAKKIPADVSEWLEYMKTKSGAVFFVVGAYTDEDGGLSIAR